MNECDFIAAENMKEATKLIPGEIFL